MRDENTFLDDCYEWLFNKEKRTLVGFIIVLFIAIIVSLTVSLFVVAIDRHVEGWVRYLWT